jgi:hypothetical protein
MYGETCGRELLTLLFFFWAVCFRYSMQIYSVNFNFCVRFVREITAAVACNGRAATIGVRK